MPDIEEGDKPPPIETPTDKAVVLIPLFESRKWHDGIEHHNAIAAAWARRSWLVNSDAFKFGIEVKFYVEDRVSDRVMPMLEANHVAVQDVLTFNASDLEGALLDDEGNPSTFGGKKCAIFDDPQLERYEWVFLCDADVFILSFDSRRLIFFQRFFGNCTEPMLGTLSVDHESEPPYRTAVDCDWCRGADGITTPKSIREWRYRALGVLSDDDIDLILSAEYSHLTPQNGILAYPAGHFAENQRQDRAFLKRAGYELVSSEAVLAAWHMLGNPIYDMRANDTPVVNMARNIDVAGFEVFKHLTDIQEPFLIHYGSTSIEYLWRQGIGAL